VGFDFLRDDIRAASPVSAAEAEELAAGYYGLEARALPLGSQQDTNFLLVGADEVNYPSAEFEGRLLYVAVTRALHALEIYATGAPSTLLELAAS